MLQPPVGCRERCRRNLAGAHGCGRARFSCAQRARRVAEPHGERGRRRASAARRSAAASASSRDAASRATASSAESRGSASRSASAPAASAARTHTSRSPRELRRPPRAAARRARSSRPPPRTRARRTPCEPRPRARAACASTASATSAASKRHNHESSNSPTPPPPRCSADGPTRVGKRHSFVTRQDWHACLALPVVTLRSPRHSPRRHTGPRAHRCRAGTRHACGRRAHVRKTAANARALCGEEAQQAHLPRTRATPRRLEVPRRAGWNWSFVSRRPPR